MIDVQVSTVINRPVADVFAFVTNFENLPRWEMDIQSVRRLSAAPGGVGTTYECVLKLPGQTATSVVEITEYVPNERIAFEGGAAGPAQPKGSYVFEPTAGGTKVTARPQPTLRGVFKVFEPLMVGYIRRSNVAHLSHLKRQLDA